METLIFLILTVLQFSENMQVIAANTIKEPIMENANYSSILRYGFQHVRDCPNFELAFLCLQKCLDLSYDVAYADKHCTCTCYKNRGKAKYRPLNIGNSTRWKLGAPSTTKPAWAAQSSGYKYLNETDNETGTEINKVPNKNVRPKHNFTILSGEETEGTEETESPDNIKTNTVLKGPGEESDAEKNVDTKSTTNNIKDEKVATTKKQIDDIKTTMKSDDTIETKNPKGDIELITTTTATKNVPTTNATVPAADATVPTAEVTVPTAEVTVTTNNEATVVTVKTTENSPPQTSLKLPPVTDTFY